MTHRLAILLTIASVAVSVTGCNWDSPLRSADGKSSDLSGTYVSSSPQQGGDRSGKFIIRRIEEGDSVTLVQSGRGILTIMHQRKGVQIHKADIDPRSGDFRWDKGALLYWRKLSPKDAAILPGYARQTRTARVYKNSEGDLVIESSFTEKGLMLFVVPFKDHDASTITLQQVQ